MTNTEKRKVLAYFIDKSIKKQERRLEQLEAKLLPSKKHLIRPCRIITNLAERKPITKTQNERQL